MINVENNVLLDIKEHAANAFPMECCGVVIIEKGKQVYVPCLNLATNPTDQFLLNPEDWVAAEDRGEPILIVHSHPGISPQPSQFDLIGCEKSGLPWLIVNHPAGTTYQFEPTGYRLPLINRKYMYGVSDCYTILADYYKEELGIELKECYRPNEWWINGQNLYLDNASEWGFVQVDEPQKHDVLLMQVGSPVPNHAAIWLGDGLILHHQLNRLSSKDVYGGWLKKITTHVFRHRSLM